MAKAHEEKLRALREVEDRYKAEIAALKARISELESATITTSGGVFTSNNSYELPATNKAMAEKVRAYQQFISEYVVKAHIEKVKAVTAAENERKQTYEAIIADLKKQHAD